MALLHEGKGEPLAVQFLKKFRWSINFGFLPSMERKMFLINYNERGLGGQGNLKEAGIILIRKSLHR